MGDLKNIKRKMRRYFDELKNINTPDEAIENFKKIFNNE